MEFSTSAPELIPQPDWMPGLLSREQYADFVEQRGGADHIVTLHEDPTTAQPLVGYGLNFVYGGLNRGFAVFGDRDAGYRLYADVDADGSLADEEGWMLSRQGDRYVVPFETTDHGQARGRPVEFPIKSHFVIDPVEPGDQGSARGVWNSRTVRRGSIELGEETILFELYGYYGRYGHRNRAIWFDLDGDGQGGQAPDDPERFRNLDQYVNIGETTYAFDVDPFGRHLTLVAEDERRAERPSLQPGETAPGFSVTSVAGDPLTLSEQDSAFVMLYFWASWCGPCRTEAPQLAEIHDRWSGDGLEIIGISTDSEDDIGAYVQTFGHDWPQVSEAFSGPVHRAYRVGAYPTKYVIDNHGKLVCSDLAASSWEACWSRVESKLQSNAE